MLGWRHVLEKNFSLHAKMCGVFRILEARRLEVFAAQRWKRCRTGLLCKLTPYLNVLQQYTWSTLPGKMPKKTFSKRINSRL